MCLQVMLMLLAWESHFDKRWSAGGSFIEHPPCDMSCFCYKGHTRYFTLYLSFHLCKMGLL